jgi:MoxR-like ATPase
MQLQAEYLKTIYASISKELGKIIVGNDDIVEQVLIAFLCGGHILLEGVPGLGKTLLCKSLARVLGLNFNRIQFTPDLMPADIVGTNIVQQGEGGSRVFTFQKGPIFANLVLADEINRATAKTQSALLEAMAEATVTVAGTTYTLDQPFFVLATQNPLEMDGTYPLPEAQLDRFFFKTLVQFPEYEGLLDIVDRAITNVPVKIDNKVTPTTILKIRELIRDVPIAQHVKELAVKIIMSTHPKSKFAPQVTKKYVNYGSSPRGLIALVHAAKCRALIKGRLAVSSEDVREMCVPILRHRTILNFEGEAEGIATDYVVKKILEVIEG